MPGQYSNRGAYTLIQLLIVMLIIAILIGLMIPAVQKFRESANVITCYDNIKQLALASQAANDAYKRLPPGLGYYPGKNGGAWGTGLFHLLPFLEHGNLYKEADGSYQFGAWNNEVFKQPISVFICPSDPTAGDGTIQDGYGITWGASSFAGNVQVFCKTFVNGALVDPQDSTTLTAITKGDGTANTILFAEHYARCTNAIWPEGGNAWAYWHSNPAWPMYPAFALSWSGDSIGPNSKFQLRPQHNNCDPTLASTGHTSGITIAMCDGSVRTLSPAVSNHTWWALCTPFGGEILGNDW